jgi:hypothetical protein
MGLKGYRLWAMGQLDSTCRAPPREGLDAKRGELLALRLVLLGVARYKLTHLKGNFEPGYHGSGSRVETRR